MWACLSLASVVCMESLSDGCVYSIRIDVMAEEETW